MQTPIVRSASISLKLAAVCSAALLAACAGKPMAPMAKPYDQSALPAAVQAPAGHKVVGELVGVGTITYECRAKANAADQSEWVFAGPEAKLIDRAGAERGRYYGPPATWQHSDGSKITGAQVAVAPAQPGSIPLQLVKAAPATGAGMMQGVAFIQRVATQGGVAPTSPCDTAKRGAKEIVKYQADYIFYAAN